MKRRFFTILTAAVMVSALVGCTEYPQGPITIPTQPTLPTLRTELTPLEQLKEAADKTRSLDAFAVTWVQTLAAGEGTDTVTHTWQVQTLAGGSLRALYQSEGEDPCLRWYDGKMLVEKTGDLITRREEDTPIAAAELFAELGAIPENGELLSIFTQQKLVVSPSNDGSFRYQATDVPREVYQRMLYGSEIQLWRMGTEKNTVVLEIDPEGFLTLLEFTTIHADETKDTLTLTVAPLNQELRVPDWATE